MSLTRVEIKTAAGAYGAEIVTPTSGSGPWAAVVLFVDAGGVRASMRHIAERIAKLGYVVAIPDLFHRSGSIALILPEASRDKPMGEMVAEIFSTEEGRTRFFAEFYGPAVAYQNLQADIGPLLEHLHARADVKAGPIGTTGYCMGGNASFRIATLFGEAIAATAAFHAGGLVTPAPDSPHLRADKIASRVYVAGATEDVSFPDEAKAALIDALARAGVPSTVETYPAKHGFAVEDHTGSYDPVAAERHFEALAELFGATLQQA